MTDDPGAASNSKLDKGSTRRRIVGALERADRLRNDTVARLETERGRRSWVRIAYEAWDNDRSRAGPLLAGGLAYRIFLWQLPASLFVVSLFGVVADGTDRTAEDVARSTGFGAAVAALVADAAVESNRARWSLLIVGLILMLWAGLGTVRAAMLTSVLAWGLPRDRAKLSRPHASVIFSFVAVSTVVLQTLALKPFADGRIGVIGAWVAISIVVGGLATLAMWLLPHAAASAWRLVPGAVLVAAALRGLSLATDLYFAGRLDRVDDLYGGLGIAVVILLYLYVAARAFVWGQFLNATAAGVRQTERGAITSG